MMSGDLDEPKQVRALRKALPYLRETGWIRSSLSKSSVDAEGAPIPWYSYAAIDFLQERVSPKHRVFEFGSGNSTLWWAGRAKSVMAVEHDSGWAAKVRATIPENVTLLEVPLEADADYCRTAQRTGSRYEIVVIDGRDRVNCALQCLESLADDAVVIWDDSHRSRYRRGFDFLAEHGFRRLRFTGLGPIAAEDGETSILYRTANCLDI
jgi:hypothetical protein